MQVYTNEGVLSDNLTTVLQKWKSDYKDLYNNKNVIISEFMYHVYKVLHDYDMCVHSNINVENVFLNEPIALYEIQNAAKKLKPEKAAGVDMLCNEILKQPQLLQSIYLLLRTCFEKGVAPTIWGKSIITPIPKDKSKCIYTPLNYRGISLLCTISKLYSSILYGRINDYCDFYLFIC